MTLNSKEGSFCCVEVSIKDRIVTQGSKGNQSKWLKHGKWYKADYLGYEGLAEYVCSEVLKRSSVSNFIKYSPILIREKESGKTYKGCCSEDFGVFMSGEIVLLQLPEKYNVFLEPRKTLAENIEVFCRGVQQRFKTNIKREFLEMLQFDQVVGNEDRILRNFGLKEEDSTFKFMPLFDHGLSLLSDLSSNERNYRIKDIVFRPFYLTQAEIIAAQGLGQPLLKIKKDEVFSLQLDSTVYEEKEIKHVLNILYESMERTEGIFWNKI